MGDLFKALGSGLARFVYAWLMPSIVTSGIFLLLIVPASRLDSMVKLDEAVETIFLGHLFKVFLDLIRASIAVKTATLSLVLSSEDLGDSLLRPTGLGGERKRVVMCRHVTGRSS